MIEPVEATAEVFWTAFQALPKKGREAIVAKLFNDQEFRDELMDIAILEQRKHEPSRSLESYLADKSLGQS